jgi:hypothetical protein
MYLISSCCCSKEAKCMNRFPSRSQLVPALPKDAARERTRTMAIISLKIGGRMTDYRYFCVNKVHHNSREYGTCVNGRGAGAAPGTPKCGGCGFVGQRQRHKNQQQAYREWWVCLKHRWHSSTSRHFLDNRWRRLQYINVRQ